MRQGGGVRCLYPGIITWNTVIIPIFICPSYTKINVDKILIPLGRKKFIWISVTTVIAVIDLVIANMSMNYGMWNVSQ